MSATFLTFIMLREPHLPNPTVQVPPWSLLQESFPSPVSGISEYSPLLLNETLSALQCFLPSNEFDDSDSDGDGYSCDEFRMYEFKVRRCSRGRSHDWTECPYAHPGEKARRRDPRKYHYSGTACADFRKGNCKRGELCDFAHGVFECWLHPSRYRTQPCKDGTSCRRRVCFFAHTPQQLRVLPQQQSPRVSAIADSYDGSPLRQAKAQFAASSPTSTLMSPPLSPPSDSSSVNEVLASLRRLQLSKVKSLPASWGLQFGSSPSPRGWNMRPSSSSLPSTPTAPATYMGWNDVWDRRFVEEEAMERDLSEENAIDCMELPSSTAGAAPDVGWVSELVM